MNTSGNSSAEPQHAAMDQFEVIDNCLQIGGRSITSLAHEHGSPFYAYDYSLILGQVARLRTALPPGVKLHYAVKANPMPALLTGVAALVDGLDVASAGELKLALSAGTAPEAISFAGPGKSRADLTAALSAGVIICLESQAEMLRLAALADAGGVCPPVAIRVNPNFELKTSGLKMGGGSKPFGVDSEKVPEMLAQISSLPLDFVGFHIFAGSQNLSEQAIIETHTKTFELALELSTGAPQAPRWLNIGGGLGVPYFPGERRLGLDPIATGLEYLLSDMQQRLGDVEIVMELGRYLVAEAGVYICEVVERKISRGKTYLITNGGLHHHLAASGNFGQVIRKNYPVCIGNRVTSSDLETVTVVGPLCTPLDILAENVHLPRAGPGDLVVVYQSGAYGFSASPKDFLGHPPPVEIVL